MELRDEKELEQMKNWEHKLNNRLIELAEKQLEASEDAKNDYDILMETIAEASSFTSQLINQNILLKKNCEGLREELKKHLL